MKHCTLHFDCAIPSSTLHASKELMHEQFYNTTYNLIIPQRPTMSIEIIIPIIISSLDHYRLLNIYVYFRYIVYIHTYTLYICIHTNAHCDVRLELKDDVDKL